MKKRLVFFFVAAAAQLSSFTQIRDTSEALALAQRCKNFQEDKADSLLIYSKQLFDFSKPKEFKQGISDAMRFKGMYYEYKEKYDTAIQYYIENLDYARRNLPPQKAIALYSDLIIVYKITKQFGEGKKYGLMMKAEAEVIKDSARLSSALMNLGVMYRNLKQKDSAIFFYNEAMKVKEAIGDKAGLATLRVNLGAYYDAEEMYQKEFETVLPNVAYHISVNDSANLYYDYTNIAAALIGMKKGSEAMDYLAKAETLIGNSSNIKLAELYELYAGLYHSQGSYAKAYEYVTRARKLEKEILNEQTNQQIADAKEKFESEKKEQENKLLSAQLDRNKLQKRNTTILAAAAGLVALLIGAGLWQKQKANKRLTEKNEIINRQVDKLAELNSEKNSLISVVSHDLAGPFSNIGVWSQLLQRKDENLNDKQREAVQHINASAKQGQQLIKNILDVEKIETGSRKIKLENFDLGLFVKRLTEEFIPAAGQKNISLHFATPEKSIVVLSDKVLLRRICENLLSNAIKYTPADRQVWMNVQDEDDTVSINVKDEGVGIPKSEMGKLFTKYSKISSQTTGGEQSTGLGLSIVKRLVDELNGEISVESEEGKGTEFTVVFSR